MPVSGYCFLCLAQTVYASYSRRINSLVKRARDVVSDWLILAPENRVLKYSRRKAAPYCSKKIQGISERTALREALIQPIEIVVVRFRHDIR